MIATKDQALKIIKNRSGWVHCFEHNSQNGVLSCNYTLDHFKSVLEDANKIEVVEEAIYMAHNLVLNNSMFFETIGEFLQKLNGGEND